MTNFKKKKMKKKLVKGRKIDTSNDGDTETESGLTLNNEVIIKWIVIRERFRMGKMLSEDEVTTWSDFNHELKKNWKHYEKKYGSLFPLEEFQSLDELATNVYDVLKVSRHTKELEDEKLKEEERSGTTNHSESQPPSPVPNTPMEVQFPVIDKWMENEFLVEMVGPYIMELTKRIEELEKRWENVINGMVKTPDQSERPLYICPCCTRENESHDEPEEETTRVNQEDVIQSDASEPVELSVTHTGKKSKSVKKKERTAKKQQVNGIIMPKTDERPETTENSVAIIADTIEMYDAPWSKVVGRKTCQKIPKNDNSKVKNPSTQPPQVRTVDRTAKTIAMLKKRVPKSAAVVIKSPDGEGKTLTSVVRQITTEVDLTALGVTVKDTRRTKFGAILLEVDSVDEAEKLADTLRSVVGKSACIEIPIRRTPVMIIDVPEWVEVTDIVKELEAVGVGPDVLAMEGITVRASSNGRAGQVVRFSLPIAVAINLAEKRRITIGWTRCRIRLLEKRTSFCFRCQERGHIAVVCQGPEKDRRCYRCHKPGHLMQDCQPPEGAGLHTVETVNKTDSTTATVVEEPAGPSKLED